jgi:hypothetical protein
MTGRSDTGDGLAEAGEVLHDRGSEPDEGWFILGADGYFDVDNATWCEFSADDAPWTTEWFEFFGTVPRILAARSSGVVTGEEAERLRGEVACRHVELPGTLWSRLRTAETDAQNLLQDKHTLSALVTTQRLRAETAEAEVERLRAEARGLRAEALREAASDPAVVQEVQWRIAHVGPIEGFGVTPASRFETVAHAALSVISEAADRIEADQ